MPGTTRTGTPAKRSSLATSSTALAMANTPGSPEETTATRGPAAASSSACAARSASTRLSVACRRWRGRAGTRSRYGP